LEDVCRKADLPSTSAVDIGLRTRILGLKEEFRNQEYAAKIDSLIDSDDILPPPEVLSLTSCTTTLDHYIKSVPESVRVAVEWLDHLLKKAPADSGQPANLNPIESNF
jgi:hypothetical protein